MPVWKLIVYVAIPVFVSCVLLAMYFSGNIVLQRIVVPNLPPLPIQDWREMGLLENLQNLLLLGMIGVAVAGAWKRTWRVERAAFGLLALFSLFIFLEEIDYGTVFYDYFTATHEFQWFLPRSEWPRELLAQIRVEDSFTLHNRLDIVQPIKVATDSVTILLFLVLPLIAWRKKNVWIQYLAPDRQSILTLIAIVLLSELTHSLGDWDEELIKSNFASGISGGRELGAINKNLSEFRELNTYYLFLVYLITLVFYRRSPAEEAEATVLAVQDKDD